MNIKRFLGIALASAIVISALAGCNSDSSSSSGNDLSAGTSVAETKATGDSTESSKELRELRVAVMTTQPDQYATYIGEQEGIFEKYNIKLETTEYAAGINTVDAIVNGTADTGLLADFAAVNRIGNTLHDTNLNLFAELNTSTSKVGGIYVAPEYADDVSKLENSSGWITTIGTVSEYFNWQAQTYLGLDPEKQKLVNTDSVQTSLALAEKGDAAAVVATGSQSSRYEDIGWKLVASPDDFGYSVGCYLVTTDEFFDANTDLLADYLKALDESVSFINDNLDSSAEKVSSKFGMEKDDFISDWQRYNIVLGSTEEGAAHLDDVNNWAYSNGKYSEEYNIRDFIRTEAVEKAFPDRVTVKK